MRFAAFAIVVAFSVHGLCKAVSAQVTQSPAQLCRISEVRGAAITCAGIGTDGATVTRTVKAVDDPDKTALTKFAKGGILSDFQNVQNGDGAAAVKFAVAPINHWIGALIFGICGASVYAYLITAQAQLPNAGAGAVQSTPIWQRPKALVVGLDNRYSNSKMQAVAWMTVLLVTYLATSILRWCGGLDWQIALNVGIADNLLVMAGLSAATAGGAKLATALKAGPPVDARAAAPGLKTMGCPNFWNDLVKNDAGEWDVGDAQMILLTIVSIVIFIINVGTLWGDLQLTTHADLPSPTNALTFAFGSSLGGYLAKKIGGTVGAA